MTRALALMGQDLFNPPNVGGWPGGVTWINASTLVERFNFAVVQGVGYPNPNLSHFRSTDIWQSALPTGVTDTGWLGRYLDGALADERNPLKAISIGSLLPKALWAKNTMVPAVQSLKAFRFLAAQHNAAEAQKVISTFQRMYGTVSDAEGPYLSLVQMAEASAYQATIELGKTSAAPPKTKYPASPLAEELKLVSQIIAANLGTRVFLVTQGGFDDHAQEAIAHPKLMKDFGDAVAAFYQDMTSHGRADQVLLMTFSEFGRRPLENASNGTDHGTAAPMLVIGGAVKGGL
jgi:uncharacterized protein (DUF1501 family)